MGLLSPWFLAGLAAVGLPFWLHLLRQFKRTPQQFSSLMFFERRIQSSTKHRRLRYLALLAMRVALLCLLALAFANPFIRRQASAAGRRALTVIAIDRSFSMRAQNRMSDAKAQAHRLIDSLPAHSPAQVLAFDARVEAFTQPESDKPALHAAVNAIQVGNGASSYGELSRSLRVLEQSSGMRLAAHVITDVQKTSLPATFADLQVGPHTAETVHAVGKPAANWAVESVDIPARVFGSNNPKLSATVAGWNDALANRTVSVLLDGRLIASKEVSIPPCGRATAEFDGLAIPYGAHRGLVRIEPHDDLRSDDEFAFAVQRSDPRTALFLYAAGRARSAFYYRSALDAYPASGLQVQPYPIEQIPAQESELSHAAFAVLNDPGELEDAVSRTLRDYVTRGGAVLIAIGPETARAGKVPLADTTVAATTTTQRAGRIDMQSQALSGVGAFTGVEFLNTPRLSVAAHDTVLARFADGSPLLTERRLGEGRVLLFASTFDNASSDFPLHSSFLPFVAQTAAYLSGAQDTPSSIVVGTPLLLRQSNTQSTAADVVGPDGRHELPLNEATRATTYEPEAEGFYEVQRANGERALLAVHADRRESDLTPIPAETMALWRNTGRDEIDSATGGGQTTVQWSLWRYALALVLAAAILESIFASRYLKEGRQIS